MLEEFPVACAEVVQSGFTVCCMRKAILGTFTVAGKQPFAFPALGGERLLLHQSEVLLLFTVHHLDERLLIDIS